MRDKKPAVRIKKNSANKNAVDKEILRYGDAVLQSDVFKRAGSETHHLHGSVSDHTLNVCIASVFFYHFLRRGLPGLREKDLIQAAMCHDLGMVGRYEKYRNRTDSWHSHPKESVRIARKLLPDLSEEAEEMILSHMWPVSGPVPSSKEGMILNIADKCASLADWASYLTKKTFAPGIKENLLQSLEESGYHL